MCDIYICIYYVMLISVFKDLKYFLNLLIAFINDSYENLVQSKDIAFISESDLIDYIEREMGTG